MIRRPLTIAGHFMLILAAVSCTMGALISAFSFNADIISLLPYWLTAALALPIMVSFLRGKGILILLLPALILLYWKLPEIKEGAKWVAFRLTSEYGKWLRVPVLFPGADAMPHEIALFFAAAGIAIAFLLSTSICLQRSLFFTCLYTAPVIFLTFVLIETTPDNLYLAGILAVYLTVLISGGIHPDDFIKQGKVLFPALALAIFLLGAAYLAAPPDSYRRGSVIDGIDEYIRSKAEFIGVTLNKIGTGWPDTKTGGWSFNTEYVGITTAGSRVITGESLLEVTASHPGTFYLRGYSMRSFNGREWLDSRSTRQASDELMSRGMPARIAEEYRRLYPNYAPQKVNMTIAKTGDASDIVYLPYYSAALESGILVDISGSGDTLDVFYQGINDYPGVGPGSDAYAIDFYYTRGSIVGLYNALVPDNYTNPAMSDYNSWVRTPSLYTQVDESTAQGLRRLAFEAGIDPSAGRAEIADQVADYISSSARYTLKPYVIPEGEDFALYFLETAKMGYCIHFATVATLMLRALDIPARFTSGFVVTVPEDYTDTAITVTDRSAHAWVEVFYDNVGWIPLEVTPSGTGSGIPGGTSHAAAAPVVNDYDVSEDNPEDMSIEDYYEFYNEYLQQQESAQGGGLGAGPGAQSSQTGRNAFIVVICAAGLALFVILRRRITYNYRYSRFANLGTNEAALYAWRYITRLCRPDTPPQSIEEIALKARFSHHRLTEEERKTMIDSVRKFVVETYSKKKLFWRVWYKYILGF